MAIIDDYKAIAKARSELGTRPKPEVGVDLERGNHSIETCFAKFNNLGEFEGFGRAVFPSKPWDAEMIKAFQDTFDNILKGMGLGNLRFVPK